MVEVTTLITSAIDGASGTTGTEMSEADFLILIQEFISIIETSLTSVKITSLALSIAQAKVTSDRMDEHVKDVISPGHPLRSFSHI